MLLLSVFETVFGGVMTIPTAAIISVVGFLIVFAILAILAVFVFGQGKLFDAILSKKSKKTDTAPAAPVQTAAPVAAPAQEPVVTVTSSSEDNIPDQDIAVIIAIVCNQSGIPLNKLRINSIKLLEDK